MQTVLEMPDNAIAKLQSVFLKDLALLDMISDLPAMGP
jgi:hypothetical protein